MDKDDRKEVKRAYKEREKARSRELLILTKAELNDLLDYLDSQAEAGATCDQTLRLTMVWASANGVGPDRLQDSLSDLGGGCDCEVLANVDPDELF